MRNYKKGLVISLLAFIVLALAYCKQDDQVLDLYNSGTNNGSTTELASLKIATPPAIDGIIDASWANATKLTTTVTVPDPGNDYFKGYVGNVYTVTMRSMYDANKI